MPQALGTIKQGTFGVTDIYTEQRKYDKDKSKFFVWRERGFAQLVHVLITAIPKISVSDTQPKHFEDGYRPLAVTPTVGTAGNNVLSSGIVTSSLTVSTTDVNNFVVNQVWSISDLYISLTASPTSSTTRSTTYSSHETFVVTGVNIATGVVTIQRFVGVDTYQGSSSTIQDLTTAMSLYITSTAMGEGQSPPPAFSQNPVVVNNYVQIFMEPYQMTEVSQKVDIFGENEWQRKARNARKNFARQLERAFIVGHMDLQTAKDGSGENQYFMGGVDEFIPSDSDHQISFGKPPTATLINTNLETVFNYGSTTKWGFCGAGALTKIGNSAMDMVRYNEGLSTQLGLEISTYVTTAGGTLHLIQDFEMGQMGMDDEVTIVDIPYYNYMYLNGMDIHIDKGPNGTGLQNPGQKVLIHQIYGVVGSKRTFADSHFKLYNLL